MVKETDMGLFKEIYCTECNKKTAMLTRTKLKDGHYLCYDCTSMIPSYIKDNLDSYSLDEYHSLKEYIEHSIKVLKNKFVETQAFQGIHIDSDHKLFYIEDFLSEPLYLEFKNLLEFELLFAAGEYKEGFLDEKVVGKLLMQMKVETPYFYLEKVLTNKIKAPAKKSFFGNKVQYENPKGMDEFLTFFKMAWYKALEEDYSKENSSKENGYDSEYVVNTNELQQAMNLFMIDDINSITVDELKKMRNRLIKTFHPDLNSAADTKYAQKINAAFDVLNNYLKSK